jgi:hypothetical protein
MKISMKANIGINEQQVELECAYCEYERVWYVHRVVYKFVDIRGCLTQEQLDDLVSLWVLNMQCEDYADGR